MVELEEGQLGPIGRRLDLGLAREGQLELDLHEIHAGVAEVLQVLVHRRLPQVVGGVEVEEERRRDAGRLGFRVDDAEEQVSFVHADSCLVWSHRRARCLVHHIAFRSARRSGSLPQRAGVPQDTTDTRFLSTKKGPSSVENGPLYRSDGSRYFKLSFVRHPSSGAFRWPYRLNAFQVHWLCSCRWVYLCSGSDLRHPAFLASVVSVRGFLFVVGIRLD